MNQLLLIWLAAANLIAFFLFGIDKRKAQKHRWRIRERSLFLLAAAGGSAGAIAGMYVFHHKTKHWYFRYGMPALLALQLAGYCLLWKLF